jgi:hypothetical protein
MDYTQTAMGFLADVPERPEPAGNDAQHLAPVDAGPIRRVSLRCREPGLYLMGGYVLCEKHMRDSVRSHLMTSRETHNRHPYVQYCADGFELVERGGREDHHALGPFERVQVCKCCKTIFPAHWLWTGESIPCPRCAEAALRKIYPKQDQEPVCND